MARLYATTGDGFARLDEAGEAWRVELALSGSGAQCLAVDPADPDTVFIGLREGGVRRTLDGGRTWIDCEVPEPRVFSLAVSAADGAAYAGTEPSRLFRSADRGETWSALDALLELPSRPHWSFPPRPWTSHVRWIAPSPHDADLLLVGIELGGLMRSTDGGLSWQDHRPGAQRDVHSLAWHPHTPGRAYEAGGGGAAFSTDAGESWQPADEGRDPHYAWSVTVDPDDPDCWYVSASASPRAAHGRRDPQARSYRQRDGERWQPLTGASPNRSRRCPTRCSPPTAAPNRGPEAVRAVVEFVVSQDADTAAGLRISPARIRRSTERGITPSCTSPWKATRDRGRPSACLRRSRCGEGSRARLAGG